MARSRVARPISLAATAAATALLLLGSAPVAVAERSRPELTSRLLPIPPGGLHSFVKGLNSSGTIVGDYYVEGSDGPLAIRWNAGRPGWTRLAPLPGERFSRTTALSDRGWAVGLSFDSAPDSHPVRWSPGATPKRLALPDGARGGNASAVNNSGAAVGDASEENNISHPCAGGPTAAGPTCPCCPATTAAPRRRSTTRARRSGGPRSATPPVAPRTPCAGTRRVPSARCPSRRGSPGPGRARSPTTAWSSATGGSPGARSTTGSWCGLPTARSGTPGAGGDTTSTGRAPP